MTSRWRVEFFEDATGCPVREFLDSLDRERRAKVLAIIGLLEETGPTLPFPYSSQVGGKLRELRAHYGNDQYRVLYFGDPERRFVLLHAFSKRTEKIARRDVKIAEARMEIILKRHDEERGKPS